MKKILSIVFIVFLLTGCTLPFNLGSTQPNQIVIDEDLMNRVKEQVLAELQEEIQKAYQSGITDVEKMIISVGKVQGKSVLGVSNFQVVDTHLQEVGTGSGVIYKKVGNDYYVITNHHVIEDYKKVSVVLPDQSYIDATVIGSDEMTDVAVIKFTSIYNFEVVEFGDSDQLQPGQFAIAIGNPLGHDYYGTLTVGNISSVSRNVPIDFNDDSVIDWTMTLIQHDTAINPGNSGGGLFDINGKLIGINNMKIVDTDVNNIGFAIPVNIVKDIVTQLESNGEIIRPSLGIIGSGVSDMLRVGDIENKIPAGITTGVYVEEIVPNSSADGTDLRSGDIIMKFNNIEIITFDDLKTQINNSRVGETVTITVYRAGTYVDITMTLKVRPQV